MVILTRIDDDDFVTKYAVQDAVDLAKTMSEVRDFGVIVCGYDSGYKYFAGSRFIDTHLVQHQNGHMSVFQSIIYDTNKVGFTPDASPLLKNHTMVLKELVEKGYNVKMVKIDRKLAYVWFRHKNAISFSSTMK